MRVLFVHSEEDAYSPEKPVSLWERMQFGISYISSYLKQAGHSTRLVVLTGATQHLISDYVEEFQPQLVCFTAVFSRYHFVTEMAAALKKSHPDLYLILGGSHASLEPESCLGEAFDAICIGEGEEPTLELVEQLERGESPAGIDNLWIKRNGNVEKNPSRPFLPDLDALPFPDREMWLPWMAFPQSRPSIMLGRGCPFKCTYCSNHALQRLAPGPYVRFRSAENIIAELEEVTRQIPSSPDVYMEVETFGVNTRWATELCSHLEAFNAAREQPIGFGTNLRVTRNNHQVDLFKALGRANFKFVNIGLESGSERVRREILKRDYSNEDVLNAVRLARENGLQVGIYNLIGIPGETPADFRETIRVNRACQPDWFLLSVFFPYPGTDLHKLAEEQGLLDGPLDMQLERRRPVLDLPGFSKRQVQRRHNWFAFFIYRGHRPMHEILYVVSRARIFQSRLRMRIFRRISKAVS